MGEHDQATPEYTGTAGGAYTTEEHLKAQQEQVSAQTGKPLVDPAEAADAHAKGDHDDPSANDPGPGAAGGGAPEANQPIG